MISPYHGEFMIHPVPLEVSFGDCSHACGYCFVRLNQYKLDERYSHQSLVNLLARKEGRRTLTASLLADGYPVLISNRSDPLSAAVWPKAKAALEVMTELGVKAAFQTKGTKKAAHLDELLDILDYPAAWYVTITTLDPKLAAVFEPNAPSPQERLAMVEKLASAGHAVAIGFNPCVEAWHDGNPEAILKSFADAGAYGIWAETLHINNNQLRVLSPKVKAAFDAETLRRAMTKAVEWAEIEYLFHVGDLTKSLGLEFFWKFHHQPSRFFEPYRKLYDKTFPILLDAIAALGSQSEADRTIIDFDDFWQALTSQTDFPAGRFNLQNYVGAANKSLLYDGALNLRNAPYKALVKLIYHDARLKISPCFTFSFGQLLEDGTDHLLVEEGSNLAFYLFDKKGSLYDAYAYESEASSD